MAAACRGGQWPSWLTEEWVQTPSAIKAPKVKADGWCGRHGSSRAADIIVRINRSKLGEAVLERR
eukprot:12928574-Prorocentrum_lima.AAC.1